MSITCTDAKMLSSRIYSEVTHSPVHVHKAGHVKLARTHEHLDLHPLCTTTSYELTARLRHIGQCCPIWLPSISFPCPTPVLWARELGSCNQSLTPAVTSLIRSSLGVLYKRCSCWGYGLEGSSFCAEKLLPCIIYFDLFAGFVAFKVANTFLTDLAWRRRQL